MVREACLRATGAPVLVKRFEGSQLAARVSQITEVAKKMLDRLNSSRLLLTNWVLLRTYGMVNYRLAVYILIPSMAGTLTSFKSWADHHRVKNIRISFINH